MYTFILIFIMDLTNVFFLYQLALTHSPALSEIFVFTDASPKDAHLYSAVKALTLEKQCKVRLLDSKYQT